MVQVMHNSGSEHQQQKRRHKHDGDQQWSTPTLTGLADGSAGAGGIHSVSHFLSEPQKDGAGPCNDKDGRRRRDLHVCGRVHMIHCEERLFVVGRGMRLSRADQWE